MTYGYVRVSSRDQNEERQIIAMHEFGVDNRQIYLCSLYSFGVMP